MAGKGSEATQFKQGGPGGPGRKKLSQQERIIRDATKKELLRAWKKIYRLKLEQLEEMAENPNARGMEVGMALAFLHWRKTGDFSKVDRILDRVIGKPKQPVEISGDEDNPLFIDLTFPGSVAPSDS